MGHDKLLHQRLPCKQPVLGCKSETLDTRSCCIRSPCIHCCRDTGAASSYGKSFRAAATQGNLCHVQGLQEANAAAISAWTAAVSNGKTWSVHAVDEQAGDLPPKLQRTKCASCSRTTRAFSSYAVCKYMLDFKCARSAVGTALLR